MKIVQNFYPATILVRRLHQTRPESARLTRHDLETSPSKIPPYRISNSSLTFPHSQKYPNPDPFDRQPHRETHKLKCRHRVASRSLTDATMMPVMDPLPALQQILVSLPAQAQDFLLRPTQTAHLTLALSTPPKTHVHSIATQTKSHPLPDSLSHTLYQTLPSTNLGFQINVRACSHATFRTYRDDEKGIFLRVANYGDTLHVACTQRLSGAVRRSYQAFVSGQFTDPTFVFHVVEIGRCSICGRRELCGCNGYTAEFNGVFEGIGRAVWHHQDRDDVVDVITRSQVTETHDLTLASGLRQRALGECLTNVPVQLTRLALPRGRMIVPSGGTVQQVQEEMRIRYEEETRKKIEERKMRNRRAAVQSNVKKKLMVEKMKKELADISKRKEWLLRRQRELKHENQRLKNLVLETGDLDDFLVDGFVLE